MGKSNKVEKLSIGNFNEIYKELNLGVPKNAEKIINVFIENNNDILISGGFVRDIVLKKIPKDIDFVTNISYEEIEKLIKKNFLNIKHINAQGKTFQVIRVIFANGEEYEIATYRKDGNYSDGIHPDKVEIVLSSEFDAKRRDFTINALFYDPVSGYIIDYVSGLKDINDRKLRFVGDPEKRINEDKSRMLRYIRFLLTTGFDCDEKAKIAINKYAQLISVVPNELVKKELDKMIILDNGSKIIELLDEYNLLKFIFPELKELENCEQSAPYHMEGNVLVHTKMVCSNLENSASPIMKWSAMFHDLGKLESAEKIETFGKIQLSFNGHADISAEKTKKILRRLKFTKYDSVKILYIVKNHMEMLNVLNLVNNDKQLELVKFIKKHLRKNDQEDVVNLINFGIADYLGCVSNSRENKLQNKEKILNCLLLAQREFEEELKKGINIKELVDGKIIMNSLNIKSGPKIKEIKNQIIDNLSDENFDTKKQLERRFKELLQDKNLIK